MNIRIVSPLEGSSILPTRRGFLPHLLQVGGSSSNFIVRKLMNGLPPCPSRGKQVSVSSRELAFRLSWLARKRSLPQSTYGIDHRSLPTALVRVRAVPFHHPAFDLFAGLAHVL